MRTRARRSAAGYTLIEMIVAMAVGMIAAAAISTGFLGLNRLMYTQEGIRAGQAALRQSLNQVARQLRMAGYGIEPWLALGLPSGWSDDVTRNRSDRLVFRSRDSQFGRKLAVGGVSTTSLTLAGPLGAPLKRGQVLQVMCPGAIRWTYAQLAADAGPTTTSLALESPTGVFPRLNGELTAPCFNGMGAEGSYLFKVDVYDYGIELIDDDGLASTPPQPFLFRYHGLGGAGVLGEPVADNIEALRLVFLRRDPAGNLIQFVPDPAATPPAYDSPRDAPERFTDHPANAAAVRLGIVARAGVVDQELRQRGQESTIPGFAGRPDLTGPAGYRRVLYETTVPLRNLRSIGMFLPPFTSDTLTTNVCQGVAPADGFNCVSG